MPVEANAEMVDGFMDGYDLSLPEPSDNRSASYRHGFANGRADRAGAPRASAHTLRQWAVDAMNADASH